ncbi:acetyltransferase-like isoleucine patch superfamily enzyme [Pseudarthrobacter defluvii]|uniref:Acetyltransferase-like isoleucine patch superfamily enzyme n=1 Tax=Pseudarthrobacter defluvii TaxID=410837 RepID=A0ABT9UGC7_9MICC|nr:DapH/DapD/GlmU-related protein [Pseudarthrobacter defluvii]MDQ0118076.1 acetyltransferase-like isoleucine patch superfamily enzyme [Pseudarthrobacter defluvii]
MGHLTIGENVFINQGTTIHSELRISIGDRVEMGDGVTIYDTNFHPVAPGDEVKVAAVVIGDDVWLGNGVKVLPGTTIGRGSVVGAGAVVTQDIPNGTLAVGSPARVVRSFEVPPEFKRR